MFWYLYKITEYKHTHFWPNAGILSFFNLLWYFNEHIVPCRKLITNKHDSERNTIFCILFDCELQFLFIWLRFTDKVSFFVKEISIEFNWKECLSGFKLKQGYYVMY